MKSGFVSILGKPNVGKSTLINLLIGQKISIMSPKPQTTRNTIQGVYNDEDSQIIFLDTPGIHNARNELGFFMTNEAYKTLQNVDLILLVIDEKDKIEVDKKIIENFKKIAKKVILVINKVDLIKKNGTLDLKILEYIKIFDFAAVIPISAKYNKNINFLLKEIKENLSEGPKYFLDGQITDHSDKFLISELIREKILFLTEEEIPHSVCVIVEELKKSSENENLVNVRAQIIVERSSQKKIIIGKNGDMIKNIGTEARKEIMKLLGFKVFLELWGKVKKDWRNQKTDLRNFGYFDF